LQRWNNFATRPFLRERAFKLAKSLAGNYEGVGSRALLLPTADPGNLGDEAFFFGTVEELNRRQFERICVISFRGDRKWILPGTETVLLPLHHDPSGQAFLAFVQLALNFTHFFIWGADILDGSQGLKIARPRFQMANLAATLGLRTTICSFSVNASPRSEAISGFQRLHPRVQLACRDELTLSRLAAHTGAEGLILSADAAFLLKADHNRPLSREAGTWIHQRKRAGQLVMGLNINDMLCYYFEDCQPDTLMGFYVKLMEKLRRSIPNLSLVHIPHNIHANPVRHGTDDFELAQKFEDRLPASSHYQSYCLPRSVSAKEIRSVCSYVDLVFSGRMHLSIASLAEGTPVFGVAYQGKFEGLFRHFGLENMFITHQELRDPELAARFLELGIRRLPDIRRTIRERLPHVKDLARRNFDLG
jgi:polysaccharide pyruvyl transferase WcaK-like protein